MKRSDQPNRLPRDFSMPQAALKEVGAAKLKDGGFAVVMLCELDGQQVVVPFLRPDDVSWVADKLRAASAVAWPTGRAT